MVGSPRLNLSLLPVLPGFQPRYRIAGPMLGEESGEGRRPRGRRLPLAAPRFELRIKPRTMLRELTGLKIHGDRKAVGLCVEWFYS